MTEQSEDIFQNDSQYTNVYFMKIDASGHSNVILNNPSDIANRIFDLFEDTVYSSVNENKEWNNCEYANFWGWQGDGGLCVFYDKKESITAKTAISSAMDILNRQLTHLRQRLCDLSIKGDLHIRVAIHKGSLEYKGHEKRGSIHSKELNFVCHLEQITPKDSLTITEDVFRACPKELTDNFKPLDFSFENHNVYIYKNQDLRNAIAQWINNIQIEESFRINAFPQRLSEKNKTSIINTAATEIIDLGTALNTCSDYLVTTRRPAYYRNAVLNLLEKGVNYICLALNPNSDIATYYGSQRDEDLKKKINTSLDRLLSFQKETEGLKGNFKIFLYSELPYFASILVDKDDDGLAIFSPYMPNNKNLNIERADSLHVLLARKNGQTFFNQIVTCVNALINDENTVDLNR